MRYLLKILLMLTMLIMISCDDEETTTPSVAGSVQGMCDITSELGLGSRIIYKGSQALINAIETDICDGLGDWSDSPTTGCGEDMACKDTDSDGVVDCTCYYGESWDSTATDDCQGEVVSSCAL